jgi:hypothetical protein
METEVVQVTKVIEVDSGKPKVYMCAVIQDGWILNQDARVYKTLGAARNRQKRLNTENEISFDILCGYGWYPLPDGGDSK